MEDGEYLMDLSKFECISNQGSIPNLEEAEQEDDNASLNSLGEGGYQNQTLQRSSSKSVHNLQADSVRQTACNFAEKPLWTVREKQLSDFTNNEFKRITIGTSAEFVTFFSKLDSHSDKLTSIDKNACILSRVEHSLLDTAQFNKHIDYNENKKRILDQFGPSYEVTKSEIRNFRLAPTETIKDGVQRFYKLLKRPTACFNNKENHEKIELLANTFSSIMSPTYYNRFLPLWQQSDETNLQHTIRCIEKTNITCRPAHIPELNNCRAETEDTQEEFCNAINSFVCHFCKKPGHYKNKCPAFLRYKDDRAQKENALSERLNQYDQKFLKIEGEMTDMTRNMKNLNASMNNLSTSITNSVNQLVNLKSNTASDQPAKQNYNTKSRNLDIKCEFCLSKGHTEEQCRTKNRRLAAGIQ